MSRWLVRIAGREDDTTQVVGFPPAVAGPAFFRPWAQVLAAGVRLSSVCLPGREMRFSEPHLTDLNDAATRVAAKIASHAPGSVRLVGYCSGALLAAAVAARLEQDHDRVAAHLFVVNQPPPQTERMASVSADAPLGELVQELRASGATDERVLESSGMLQLLEPLIRADLRLYASPSQSWGYPPLNAGITAFMATGDIVARQTMARWQEVTSGEANVIVLNGDPLLLGAVARVAKFVAAV